MEVHRYVESRVWGSNLFAVREIRVDGNVRVPTGEILAAIPFAVGHTMDAPRHAKLLSLLPSQISDIHQATVTQDIAGGLVTVHVVEREPFARVDTGAGVLIVDESGHVLSRLMAVTSVPASRVDGPMRTGEEAGDHRLRELPTVHADVGDPGAPGRPETGRGLALGLRTMSLYEAVRTQRQGYGEAYPELLAPPIEAVDARRPEKIVVHFGAHAGRKLSAWLTKKGLVAGVKNLYHVYASRTRADLAAGTEEPARSGRTVRGATGSADSKAGRELSRVWAPPLISSDLDGEAPASGARHGIGRDDRRSSLTPGTRDGASHVQPIEELYDARFQSTIYVSAYGSSMSGGPRG